MILTYPSNILVENLTQGETGNYKISWSPSVLATGYNVYRSKVPYGNMAELIAENINELFYEDDTVEVIEGITYYYAVSSVRIIDGTTKESGRSRWQTAQNTNEYMSPEKGTWLDTNNMIYDPHSNKFPTSNQEQNYRGVNFLPLNVMRRTQFNYIQRHEMWILQDRGEPVYYFKRKKVNYSEPDEDDDRRVTARGTRLTTESPLVEFYEPIIIFAALASPGMTHDVNVSGAVMQKQTRSWTLYTPLVEDKDILIDKENKRWEIQDVVRQRSWRGATTWQIFNIKGLNVTDPVYNHPQLKDVDGTKLYAKEHYWQREGI